MYAFGHTLAEAMGEVDVKAMLERISWRQFLTWYAQHQIDPIGKRRADWQAASIAAAVQNLQFIMMRSPRRVSVADMLLQFQSETRAAAPASEGSQAPTPAAPVRQTGRQTWQDQKLIGRMWFALSKAEQKKRERLKRGRQN